MGDLEVKKQTVTDKLEKREEERLAELQKRKDEKDKLTATNESVDFFGDKFSAAEKSIQNNLAAAEGMDKAALTEHFDNVVSDLQKLQKFLSDSTMFLPPFKVQRSQASLSKLQTAIQEKRDELMPKKKFAFKSKKKTTERVDKVATDEADGKRLIKTEINKYAYSKVANEVISMFEGEVNDKDVGMARLTKCVVKIYGAPRAVQLDGLVDCQVFCGPVIGSVFIDNCKDCVFAIACQQLRVHNTLRTDFYLHVTSRAIIEDCSGIHFAPYNLNYPELDEHYEKSQLDRLRNSWDDVDDFNWLASDTPSPNWSLIAEKDRVKSWDI